MKPNTSKNQTQTESNGFLDIQIRVKVLAELLKQQKLCAEDMHCKNQQHKNILVGLLRDSVRL